MSELFGWKKDPYRATDYLHKRKVAVLPDKVSLVQYLTPVRNQGNVGSCVGFGVGINLNSVKVNLGIFDEWCSPTFIYNGARYIEGTLPMDNGCYPRDALDWTVKNGILLEHFWPYDPTTLDRHAPSSERIKQATRFKGFQYFRCVDGIDGICDALAIGYLVSIGTPWFNEWMQTDPCGRLAVPTSSSFEVGGHETCLYGYNRTEGVFHGVNSWGTGWGDKGLYIMPFESIEQFKARGGYDAHFIAFSADVDNTPEPTPSPCPVGNGMAGFLNVFQSTLGRKGRFYYRNP